jgi:putative transposase
MSSKPRIILPGVVYQVRSEAARNEKIFRNESMRSYFLKILKKLLKNHSFHCFGFSILDTHYHLVLRSSALTISKFMQKVNSAFARHYNKREGTHGAVFSKPFTSIIVDENLGLKELIRYVHLNPVRSNCCTIEELDSYAWSGHRELLKPSIDSFLNTAHVLNLFTENDKSEAYQDFVNSGFCSSDPIILQIRDANSGKQKFCDPWHQVSGSDAFKNKIIDEDQCRRVILPRYDLEKVTLEMIHSTIESIFNMQDGELMRQGRRNHRSTARELFAYVARYRFDYSGVMIAAYLKKTGSAVSRMLSRYENIDNKDYMIEMVIDLVKNCQSIPA